MQVGTAEQRNMQGYASTLVHMNSKAECLQIHSPKGDSHSGCPCSHLNDIVFSIFAVDSFDSADIKTSKHFCAGICPESVPAETTRAWPRISCPWVVHQNQPPTLLPIGTQSHLGALITRRPSCALLGPWLPLLCRRWS